MKTLILAFPLSLTACGDNIVSDPDAAVEVDAPPDAFDGFTWKDAIDVWSDAWCTFFERCKPLDYDFIYGDHANCIVQVTAHNCPNFPCEDVYPDDRRVTLKACHDGMTILGCMEQYAPDACYLAFTLDPQ